MQKFIKAGYGFTVGQNFARAVCDTPIELAPTEYARPGHVIGYISGNPASSLGFMRAARIRVNLRKDALTDEVQS